MLFCPSFSPFSDFISIESDLLGDVFILQPCVGGENRSNALFFGSSGLCVP
jgi:hypothetical protein